MEKINTDYEDQESPQSRLSCLNLLTLVMDVFMTSNRKVGIDISKM